MKKYGFIALGPVRELRRKFFSRDYSYICILLLFAKISKAVNGCFLDFSSNKIKDLE